MSRPVRTPNSIRQQVWNDLTNDRRIDGAMLGILGQFAQEYGKDWDLTIKLEDGNEYFVVVDEVAAPYAHFEARGQYFAPTVFEAVRPARDYEWKRRHP